MTRTKRLVDMEHTSSVSACKMELHILMHHVELYKGFK